MSFMIDKSLKILCIEDFMYRGYIMYGRYYGFFYGYCLKILCIEDTRVKVQLSLIVSSIG